MEWNEIKLLLPSQKPKNNIERHTISCGKVLDGILNVSKTGVNGRRCQKKEHGSDSTCIRGWSKKYYRKIYSKHHSGEPSGI
jgi:hypothetical protein